MKKNALILVVVIGGLVLAALAGGAYVYSLSQPVSQTPQPTTVFEVPKGQSVSLIAARLAEAGFIRHPVVFRLEVKRLGLDGKIQAGSFELSPSMTLNEIAQELTSGSTDFWVTIPEGWRREEIAESLAAQDLPNFDEAEFLELTATSEGKLFPDTYLIPKDATAQSIYELLTDTFEQKIIEDLAAEIDANPRSFEDNLIMASLVEREARGYEQMRQVAGVLWNRIELGMPLQVDATLQYVKGYHRTEESWWVPPLGADRLLDSPFNTYQNPGLPPRPIANPGLEAFRATLHPAATDNLFYIHDNQGNVHFAETLDEHNQNINRYLR